MEAGFWTRRESPEKEVDCGVRIVTQNTRWDAKVGKYEDTIRNVDGSRLYRVVGYDGVHDFV